MLDWMSKAKEPRLLTIPIEIRLSIHEYVLSSSSKTVTFGVETFQKDSLTEATQPPLTRVSRQIRSESLPVYYECNDFILHTEGSKASDARRWLVCTARNFDLMRRVSFWFRYIANQQPAQGAMSISILRPKRNDDWVVDEHWKWITVIPVPAQAKDDAGFIIDKLKSRTMVISGEGIGPEDYVGLMTELRTLYQKEKMS